MTDKQPEESLLKAVTQAFGPDGEPTAFDASTWGEIHGAITWMLEENRRVRAANIDCVNHFDALLTERNELLDALNAMMTHMGMDEDEWNKPTFDKARAAIARATGETTKG